MSNSNNFDLLKLFATIFNIINDFLAENPYCSLHIAGNTPKKSKLYHHIIKNNLLELQDFLILGVDNVGNATIFDAEKEYDYFVIRLKP